MPDGDFGPGCDPALYRRVDSYCEQPRVTAKFIPHEETDYPVQLFVTIIEISDFVYGQVLSERLFRTFEGLPHIGAGEYPRSQSLEYETEAKHDPLRALRDVLQGLEDVAQRVCDSSPVLQAIHVLTDQYVELSAELMREYGTPFVELDGRASREDVLQPADDTPAKETLSSHQSPVPLQGSR